jgi:hypothetical protein
LVAFTQEQCPMSSTDVFNDLLAEARRLFPMWDEPRLHRWAHARAYAARCAQQWHALIPHTQEQFERQVRPWGLEPQFAARTRREAGLA